MNTGRRVIGAEKAAGSDVVEGRIVGRYGRFFMSGGEASVQTAMEVAVSVVGAVDGRAVEGRKAP